MGPALCLLSAACFGAMAIFGKFAYTAGVTPDTLLLVRFGLAAVILAALLSAPRPLAHPRPSRPWWQGLTLGVVLIAVALGAIGYATQATLYFAALRLIDASLLALIFYTYPLLVTIGAIVIGRDRLTSGRAAALIIASAGTLLVLLGTGGISFNPLGALLAVGAAATYTVYILTADTIVHRIAPLTLSTLVMASAATTIAIRSVGSDNLRFDFPTAGWVWLACIAVVSTVLAMLTFFAGLRRTGPSTAAILSTLEPVVTAALATLLLHEQLTTLQFLGGFLVLAAIGVLQIRRRPTLQQPQRERSGADATLTTPEGYAPPARQTNSNYVDCEGASRENREPCNALVRDHG